MGDFADDYKYDYTDYESGNNVEMCANCGEIVRSSELYWENNKTCCKHCK